MNYDDMTVDEEILHRAQKLGFPEAIRRLSAPAESAEKPTDQIPTRAGFESEALRLLAEIVAQYDAAPDGPLGKGFTNEPFLAAREFLSSTNAENEPNKPDDSNANEVDVPRLVRLVVERAEQACRYVVKHQDFSESDPAYAAGFRVGSNVCEMAIADHIERHLETILSEANA